MKRFQLLFVLLLSLPLAAQTDKPKAPAPVPAVSDALRAKFFKAQSQMIQANEQAKQQQKQYQAVTAEIQKACGDAYFVQLDETGDPVCIAKPEPKE